MAFFELMWGIAERREDASASPGLRYRTWLLSDRVLEMVESLNAFHGYNLTVTVFTSVYCCNPYSPNSRPIPDCLKPPNGARVSST
jgi:hypothetical protein